MGRRCRSECHAGPPPILNVDASVDLSVQLAFDPLNPHIIYASFQQRDEIHGWDLRGSAVTPRFLMAIAQGSRRNRGRDFDIDLGGKPMGVGDQVGVKVK